MTRSSVGSTVTARGKAMGTVIPPNDSDQTLASALERISKKFQDNPTVDTVLIAVREEREHPGADVQSIKGFGKILFEAAKKREADQDEMANSEIDKLIQDFLAARKSR